MTVHDEVASHRDSNRKTLQLALWTLAWLATLAIARFGPTLWGHQPTPNGIAVAANVLVGIAWIVAFARFLRAQDDLWRKITQDALAIALGAGWVVGFGWFAADAAGVAPFELNVALLPALMGVAYLIAVAVGWMRYR